MNIGGEKECYQLKTGIFHPFVLYLFSSLATLGCFLFRYFLLLLSPSAMMYRVIVWSMMRHRELLKYSKKSATIVDVSADHLAYTQFSLTRGTGRVSRRRRPSLC